MLVPEIALAPQTVGRFRQRFGDTVAILHSALGQAERRDERDRIARGEARIVVGARSAIFAPMRDLGLVIVDEEHDSSFKQESDPRYDARTVAAKRAALEGAVAVYGSATPRPESWAHARAGRASRSRDRGADAARSHRRPPARARLPALGAAPDRARPGRRARRQGDPAAQPARRHAGAPLPRVRARRGAAANCDVALTLHGDGGLHCHHCGYREAVPATCPSCGSVELAHIGAGTQRLEKELERNVPELERIRLDADTAARPGALRETLERFRSMDRAVLIGTQMVAKGHHFPGVDLAAVVDADTGLAIPDFRAEERTFQLVTQLAGRSGRDAPGLVLVQTFQPDAMPFQFAQRHDVAGFLTEELERRTALGYPPVSHLVTVVASGPDAAGVAQMLREVREGLAGVEATLLGPAPLLRLRGRHRAQLVAKTQEPRALARRASALLTAASPALRAPGADGGRRRRPAVAVSGVPLNSRRHERPRPRSRSRPRPRPRPRRS